MFRTFVLALVLSLSLASAANASERCPTGRIIEVGQSTFDVLEVCGEPYKKIFVDGTPFTGVFFERWIYNMGSGKFLLILEFTGGTLVNAVRGARAK